MGVVAAEDVVGDVVGLVGGGDGVRPFVFAERDVAGALVILLI